MSVISRKIYGVMYCRTKGNNVSKWGIGYVILKF